MPDTPIRAYPDNYTPSDLDIHLDHCCESSDGTMFRPPDMELIAGTCGA